MTAEPDAETLSTELERALLKALVDAWDQVNFTHFRTRLRRPALELGDARGKLGLWNLERRTLSLARTLVLDRPWGEVIEVLKHEMAHQYVHEVLRVTDETAHGPAFAEVCRERGIDAAATGSPRPAAAADVNHTKVTDCDAEAGDAAAGLTSPAGDASGDTPAILRRIGRLLALADSPNLHEAESAMREAQRLMLKHNLAAAAITAQRGFAFRQLGVPRARVEAAEQILGGLLSEHFFVEVIWVGAYDPRRARKGRVLEICGTAANLEVASWVHGYLLETSERLWLNHKRSAGLRGDKERRRFRLGVMMGFRDKLAEGARAYQQEGLIWTGDPALERYFKTRHPRQSTGRSIGYHATAVFEHGRRAGQTIVLRRPIGSQAESRGRLLGPTSR